MNKWIKNELNEWIKVKDEMECIHDVYEMKWKKDKEWWKECVVVIIVVVDKDNNDNDNDRLYITINKSNERLDECEYVYCIECYCI